ncbi:MAG TPA: COX15/CtaA family protein [Acidimicrobiales bacterium]
MSPRRPFTVSPSRSHRLNLLALALVALIVVTGGAVRLTDSGLGCADWPTCSVGHLTPALQFHSLVEFGNRLVTVLITIAVAASFLGTVFRAPRRRDLVWLSGGLVAGVIAQAVLGGIVVYTKLNPYLVMVHFFATMLLLVDAVVLVHRSQRDYSAGSARRLIPLPLMRLHYGVLGILALVIAAGTATTGAGPHAGDATGQQVAKRIPIALRDMAELHSSLVLLLVGLTIGLVVGFHLAEVPERVRKAGRILLGVMVAQAAVGYTQYFTHLPALLVEVHLIGVTMLVVAMVKTFLVCTYHRPEPVVPTPAAETVEGDDTGPVAAGVPISAH